jgi:hypothetical protein
LRSPWCLHPHLVIIFFRDENLTDALFRVTGPYRIGLDRVAHDREPALNRILAIHTRGAWYRVHDALAAVRLVASQACLCGLLVAVILALHSRTSLDFIYFQF